jgi:hypothetical protein
MKNLVRQILVPFLLLFAFDSTTAAEVGLLLGLRQGSNYNITASVTDEKMPDAQGAITAYRTFWIRAKEGAMELAAERTNLIVPRDDGFWRLDVKRSVYNNFEEDFIWINPAPDPDALPNPFLAEQEGIDAFDLALLIKEQGIDMPVGEYCRGHAYRDILFVGIDYLSVGYQRHETCNGLITGSTDSALQMLTLSNLEPVNLSALLGVEGSSQFIRTAKDYADKYQGDKGNNKWGDLSGGVVRHQGKWIVKGHYPLEDGKYTLFDVSVIPTTLVLHDQLSPEWATISKLVPDAIDAFSAPTNDVLIVLTATRLLGFTVNGKTINPQPALQLYLKQPVTVIMARWAEGQYVANWTQEIQNIGPNPQKSWLAAEETRPLDENLKLFGVVVGGKVNIRQGLGQHTKPVGQVQNGSKLPILDVFGQWYQVQLSDKVGYIHHDYLKVLPKLPYIQTSCPEDVCNYGSWKLKKETTLYSKPSLTAAKVAKLEALQKVEALTGEIHTLRYGEIEVIKGVTLTEDNNQLALKPGDRLFDLESVGLGMHAMWYNGDLYYLNNGWNAEDSSKLWGNEVVERQTDWWVKVIVAEKNLTGWIVNPQMELRN